MKEDIFSFAAPERLGHGRVLKRLIAGLILLNAGLGNTGPARAATASANDLPAPEPIVRLGDEPGEEGTSLPLDTYPQWAAGLPPGHGAAVGDREGNDPATLSFTGMVEDETGLPVAGALVTLELRIGLPIAHAVTDASGRFVFSGLAEGHYLVVVEKEHFDTERRVITVAAASPPAQITLHANPEVTVSENKAPWDINTSGPNYTGTADVEPAGSWYFEPWIYDSITPRQGQSTDRVPMRLALGLGHDLELDIWQSLIGNYQSYPSTPRGVNVGDWGFGNFHLQLKYQFAKDADTYHLWAMPSLAMSVDFYTPIGKYQDLSPNQYGADQFVNGTNAEEINFLIRKRFKPFEFYGEVGYLVQDPTRVGPGYTFDNGIAFVPPGLYGVRMVDGDTIWWGAALEHVLNDEYGIGYVLELTGQYQSGSSVWFGTATAPPYSYVWGVPAIEFNWPQTRSVVVSWGIGVALPIAQHNFPRTYTPLATFTLYYNGGGPR
jgi:hypothetical protein